MLNLKQLIANLLSIKPTPKPEIQVTLDQPSIVSSLQKTRDMVNEREAERTVDEKLALRFADNLEKTVSGRATLEEVIREVGIITEVATGGSVRSEKDKVIEEIERERTQFVERMKKESDDFEIFKGCHVEQFITYLEKQGVDSYELKILQLGIDQTISEIAKVDKQKSSTLKEFWSKYQFSLFKSLKILSSKYSSSLFSLQSSNSHLLDSFSQLTSENTSLLSHLTSLRSLNTSISSSLHTSATLLQAQTSTCLSVKASLHKIEEEVRLLLPNFREMLGDEDVVSRLKSEEGSKKKGVKEAVRQDVWRLVEVAKVKLPQEEERDKLKARIDELLQENWRLKVIELKNLEVSLEKATKSLDEIWGKNSQMKVEISKLREEVGKWKNKSLVLDGKLKKLEKTREFNDKEIQTEKLVKENKFISIETFSPQDTDKRTSLKNRRQTIMSDDPNSSFRLGIPSWYGIKEQSNSRRSMKKRKTIFKL
jgi:hypothetical protein